MHQQCQQLPPDGWVGETKDIWRARLCHSGQHEVLPVRPTNSDVSQCKECGLQSHQLSIDVKGTQVLKSLMICVFWYFSLSGYGT